MNQIILILIAVLIVSGLNIICFFIGAKIGQKIVNNEEVKIPSPIVALKESVKNYEENKEAEKEQNYYDTINYNIDVYDGTPMGQKEIPK